MASRSISWRWVVGSLVIAVPVVLGLLFRARSHPVAVPSRVSVEVRAELPRPVARPLVIAPEPLPDNASKIEICGLGKVPLDSTDPFAAGRYMSALTRRAKESWQAALLGSDNYRARAAGLILEGKIANGDSILPMAERTRDELVQLAVGARDPAVYAMAVYACSSERDDPANSACQQISLSTWARTDADNAVPWLLLAGKARAEHDLAVETEAFSQAAKAHRTDSYNDSLYAFAESQLPKDVTPLERWYFAIELIGIEGAARLNQYTVASKRCSIEAVQDSKVRQQCNALAELLATKGTTLLDLGIAADIGARAGWSSQRVAGLIQKRNALMQAIRQATPMGNDEIWSCNGVHLGNAYMNQRVRLGELGAARESLDRSGETEQDLARKQLEFMESIRHEALQQPQEQPVEPAP